MPLVLERWVAPLPSTHPAAAGPIAFRVESDGGVITGIEPRLDLVHRGTEKLFASRDYRQCLVLADRHDWHSAFNSELGLVMLLEDAMGIDVSEQAQWARTLLAELSRAIHAFAWLGGAADSLAAEEAAASQTRAGADGNAESVARACHDARAALVSAHEAMSGGRMHPMVVRPGGLRVDWLPDWPATAHHAADRALSTARAASGWLAGGNAQTWRGKAAVDESVAEAFAASGPVARASGINVDLRRDSPYAKYGELVDAGVLDRQSQGPRGCDALARLGVVAAELMETLACISFSADRLANCRGGDAVRLPRTWRVPAGEYYVATEGPTGINGWFLVAGGGPCPDRLKIVSASFANAQALCAGMIGKPVEDLIAMAVSSLLIAGDLGR